MRCEELFTEPCNIMLWKRYVKSIGLQAPSIGLGEFPAEQPNDLPLSPTAEAFYALARPSGNATRFCRRFSTGLHSLSFRCNPDAYSLNRLRASVQRWSFHVRRIDQLHRALGHLERELAQKATHPERKKSDECTKSRQLDVESLRVAPAFEVDWTTPRRTCGWCRKTSVEWSMFP